MLFFAEVLFPQDWTPAASRSLDGAELVEESAALGAARIPAIHYPRLYENYTDARWAPGSLQETARRVLDSLDRRLQHRGPRRPRLPQRHVVSATQTIENADALALTNGNRLSNMYAIDCTSNAIDFPCIGEAFLHAAERRRGHQRRLDALRLPTRGARSRRSTSSVHVRRQHQRGRRGCRRGRSSRSWASRSRTTSTAGPRPRC